MKGCFYGVPYVSKGSFCPVFPYTIHVIRKNFIVKFHFAQSDKIFVCENSLPIQRIYGMRLNIVNYRFLSLRNYTIGFITVELIVVEAFLLSGFHYVCNNIHINTSCR